MFRHSACAALVTCVGAVGFAGCRSQEATPAEDSLPPSGGATTEVSLSPEPSAPTVTRNGGPGSTGDGASLAGADDHPPDELFHAAISEGMTDLEAVKYWAVEGGGHKWAIHHAEAALRSDPGSVEALAPWAQELPIDRRVERQAAFMTVLERDPTHYAALVSLANTTAMERPHESIEYA